MKNVHNFGIFQPIWLKFSTEPLNGKTKHMYVIYMHLSLLTDQTDLPPNQPTNQKVKNLHNFVIFQLKRLLLPNCSTVLNHGPCLPACDCVLRVSGCQNWAKLAFPRPYHFLSQNSFQTSRSATFNSIGNHR